jgi:hypothetical protein
MLSAEIGQHCTSLEVLKFSTEYSTVAANQRFGEELIQCTDVHSQKKQGTVRIIAPRLAKKRYWENKSPFLSKKGIVRINVP